MEADLSMEGERKHEILRTNKHRYVVI